jgi:hypothetical protein
MDALRKYATLLFLGSAIAAVILISLLREPLNHVIEVLLASKPVPVSAAVLFLLLIICIFNIAVSLFTFGALFLLKDVLREVGEKLPRRRRKGEEDE